MRRNRRCAEPISYLSLTADDRRQARISSSEATSSVHSGIAASSRCSGLTADRILRRLEGKVAIVTGGAKGLGAAFTRAIAAEGATVVIADVVDGESLAAEVRETCGPCSAVVTDVSDEQAVHQLVDSVMEDFGRIDILVNNAAVFSTLPPTPVLEIDVETWDKVMAVNVRGSFLMAKHVAPAMVERRQGKIINVSSGTAYKGQPTGMAHYVTSKGAVLSLTRALSRELGDHGICVNTLAPGLTLSDSILKNEAHIAMAADAVLASRALKRHGQPQDLIGALLFLASSDSDFVTGQTIAVDGGSINT